MRLTPRSKKLGIAALALAAFVTALVVAVRNFPGPPQAPRWIGAGNPTPRSGGVLRFGEGGNVHTLDPQLSYDVLGTAASRLMYDGLLDYDLAANLVPSLATSLPEISDDGKSYTFALRNGVKFHNGDELTAEDVRWSMHRLLSQKLGSPGYPFFKSVIGAEAYHDGKSETVEGIVVNDRYSITFRLLEPDHTFLNAIAMPFAYPLSRRDVETAEATYASGGFGTHPSGIGPFRLVNWERGVVLEFERFESYWDERPRVDRVMFYENVDSPLAGARVRNGEFEIINRPSRTDTLFFRSSPAWANQFAEHASPATYGITLNCGLAPFDNVHVRRAFSFAVNRKRLEQYDPVRFIAADQLLPASMPGHFDDLENRQVFDLERAREEMKLAGHPHGFDEPVTVWITEGGESLTQLIEPDLNAIGIKLKLKIVSFATYLMETGKPRVAQATFSGWHADFPDPSNFTDILFHSRSIHPENSENRAFYRNPELDAELDLARTLSNQVERLRIYREASERIAHDAPWVFLYYPREMLVWQPYVHNLRVHPVWSHPYRDVWIDGPVQQGAR